MYSSHRRTPTRYTISFTLPAHPVQLELLRIPGSRIAQTASTGAGTLAAEIGRQVFGGDLLEQFGLVVFPQDGDFGDGDFVEPGFDEGPDGGEEVGGLEEASDKCKCNRAEGLTLMM